MARGSVVVPEKKLYRPRKKINRHCLIDFRGLAKTTGAKWKALSAEERMPFEEQAKQDLFNYQKAMIRYHDEIADYEKRKGNISSEDLPAAETAAEATSKATASVRQGNSKPLHDCVNASEGRHMSEGFQKDKPLNEDLIDMLVCSSSTAMLSDCHHEQSASQNNTTMNDSTASSSPALESQPQVPAFQLALRSARLTEKAHQPEEVASCLHKESLNEITCLASLLTGGEGLNPRSASTTKKNYLRKHYHKPGCEATAKIPIIQPAMVLTADTLSSHERNLPAASDLVKFVEGDFF